jgi:hypothetical protein
MFVVDTAFVAFVVGTDLSRLSRWSRWWPRSGAVLLLSGLAVGTLTPFGVVIVASGGLLVGWVVRWLPIPVGWVSYEVLRRRGVL